MELAARGGGERRFVLVQLPEPLDESSKDQAAPAKFCAEIGKPANISELTKERLRRASGKVRGEYSDYRGDLGFRVFRLSTSNFLEWNTASQSVEEDLLASIDHVRAGRTSDDLLYELILKFGLDLCLPIEMRRAGRCTLNVLGGGVLMTCLDSGIGHEDVESIAEGVVNALRELAPAGDVTCVFRDSAFSSDVDKVNLSSILEQSGISNVRSV